MDYLVTKTKTSRKRNQYNLDELPRTSELLSVTEWLPRVRLESFLPIDVTKTGDPSCFRA